MRTFDEVRIDQEVKRATQQKPTPKYYSKKYILRI